MDNTTKLLPKTLPVSTVDVFGASIVVVNVCSLVEYLFGETCWGSDYSYDVANKAIKEFCEEYACHYYARPREEFSYADAAGEARALDLKVVIVEDLS